MKKFNLSSLFVLLLSVLILTSCSDKKVNDKKVPQQKLTPAKTIVKKDTVKKTLKVALKKAIKKQAIYKNPYHIIIGSFSDKANAQKLASKYKGAYIINRTGKHLFSVSINGYADEHQAYNNMYDFEDSTDIKAWVLFQKNK